MTIRELNALAKACKKHGIKRLKTAQVELEIDLNSRPPLLAKEAPISQPDAETPPPSEEDILFWSSAGVNNG